MKRLDKTKKTLITNRQRPDIAPVLQIYFS